MRHFVKRGCITVASAVVVIVSALSDEASGQLLFWIEDGEIRSLCVESGATDLFTFPEDLLPARELTVADGHLLFVSGAYPHSGPVSINRMDIRGIHGPGCDTERIAASEWDLYDLEAGENWPSEVFGIFWITGAYDHRIDSATINQEYNRPVEMGPFSYRLPDDFGGFGSPDVTVTLSVYREDLYFIVSDFYEYWLVRVSLDSHQAEVFEMFDATREVVADSNHIYVLEGLHERSVVRYDYSYSPASREVLLDADFFGPDGRIEDITLERLAFSTFALHVLHTHALARVPLDGGDPAIVYTFDADDPPERPRCCLNAVYTRPSECGRTYGDFDADGVIRLCDKCPDTPPGVEVDDTGRPVADVNQDCVVDRQDFAIVRESFTRSAGKGRHKP